MFCSGLVRGSYLVRRRVRVRFVSALVSGFVSGSCLASVWVRVGFVSGSCLVRVWFASGRVWVRVGVSGFVFAIYLFKM